MSQSSFAKKGLAGKKILRSKKDKKQKHFTAYLLARVGQRKKMTLLIAICPIGQLKWKSLLSLALLSFLQTFKVG